jgi:succinate dehydrogenase/fumarate reductase flavoprotein subunit
MADATEADVIVIGGGGAGLAAAYEAAKAGSNVILLEKNPAPGGSTSWSLGAISASCTPHQREAGIADSADAHFEDLALHAGPLAPRANLALRRILVDNTSELIQWLTDLGLVFAGPEPDPPNRVPRMHNAVPNSKALAYHLTRQCRRLGVDIRINTACKSFICDRGQVSGQVNGVQAQLPDGSLHAFIARKAVVLASGDYSGAPDLKEKLASPALAEVDPVNVSATGDGHRMALEIGATVINGDIVRGPIMRFIPPARPRLIQKLPPARPVALTIAWAMLRVPKWIMRPFLMNFLTTALGPSPGLLKEGAILVNKEGRRFTDEKGKPNADVALQPERKAWFVFDQNLYRKFSRWPYFISTAPGVAYAYMADYRRNRADIFHEAGTLEGLAASTGVPAENLAATFAGCSKLRQGPFFALGPVKSYVVFTDGGLKVSESLEVLRSDDSVIAGLYGAGSAGQGGLLLEGHGHHLAWAFISGRIAGRNAANYTRRALR